MGYAQELARRMSGFSNFAISFSIICILAGGITSFPTAICTGYGFGVAVGWIVGGVFALIVAAGLAQIGSAYPTAGGLYHWSSILGGRGWGWATAWINLIGLIFVVAAVDVGVYTLFQGLVAPVFHIDASAWGFKEQTIAVILIAGSQGLFNHLGIKVTTMLTDFSGYLIFVVAVVLTLTFLVWGATFDLSRLFTFVNTTGAPGGGFVPDARSAVVAFLIGLLYPLFTITGFDASAHTSEETVNARVAVPRGMLQAVFWSLIFGFVMAASFVLASPDLAATAKDGANAWFNMYAKLPAPVWLKDILAIAIVVSNYLCGLACLTSTSRMIFAFSRDGGLPGSSLWKKVSPRWRTPVPAIWLGVVLAIASTLYSPAFAALAAGCALFLYLSYAMPIGAGLLAIGKSWTTFGPFTLGVWYKPLAAITVVGVLILLYAGLQPPNDIIQNYAIGVGVLLVVLWFGLERRRFKGPPIGSAALAERQAVIAREEQALV
ncbi:MAG: amino acid permease [Beijerinckiaceae bacterium]|nr:amino acid permease [Beijerinckiaceae bacterium]